MTPPNVRLGKKDYEFDAKTLKIGEAISTTVVVPAVYDFDRGRHPFPLEMWGNDQWGNCAKVSQANEIIRLERLEQRKTLPITANDVIEAYKQETGAQSPGDPRDEGLVMLQNNRLWRTAGFPLKTRRYKIAAFGELDPNDMAMLRAAVFLLHGVQFGFALPRACQNMGAVWDYQGGTGEEWAPGSWGGHAVFSKSYNRDGMGVLTWGMRVHVTNAFIKRYSDEAWAVVDDFDNWRSRPEIDIEAIKNHLHEIGATDIE